MEENASERAPKRRKPSGVIGVDEPKGPGLGIAVDYSEYFHVSIAWNLAEPASSSIKLANGMDIGKSVRSLRVSFSSVKARVGNTVHNIDLGRATAAEKGPGILGLA